MAFAQSGNHGVDVGADANPLSSDEAPLTNAQIAGSYGDALRQCVGLRVFFTQSDSRATVAGWSLMAPGRVKTVVWLVKPQTRALASMLSMNQSVREFRSTKDGTLREYEYPASDANGTAQSPAAGPHDCLWGSNTSSWVGAGSENAELFGERIRIGSRESDEEVNGHPCYVVRWRVEAEDGVVLYQRFFVDKQLFLLVRLDTGNISEGRALVRVRQNSYRVEPALRETDWSLAENELDVQNLQPVFRELGLTEPPSAVGSERLGSGKE